MDSDNNSFCCFIDDSVTSGVSVVTLRGSPESDTLSCQDSGTGAAIESVPSALAGEDGDDSYVGSLGTTFAAQSGLSADNEYYLGTGDNTVEGGPGRDIVVIDASVATNVANLYQGNDSYALDLDGTHHNDGVDIVDAGAGDDDIYGFGGVDELTGGAGADYIYGGNQGDSINGNNGNDHLFGESGPDVIYGDNDNDTIEGGGGNDTIHAGSGNDCATGGNGDDVVNGDLGADYVYSGSSDSVGDKVYGSSAGVQELPNSVDRVWADLGVSATGATQAGDLCGDSDRMDTWAGSSCTYSLATYPTCPL